MSNLKIFTVDFPPVWPVGCGLVIAAKDKEEAEQIAKTTIKHTGEFTVKECDLSSSCVLFYESGDY